MRALALGLLLFGLTPAALAQTPIAPGQTLGGTLGPDARLLSDDSYYDAYVFEAEPGQAYTVTLRSGAFDAYLSVTRDLDGGADWYDDDSGGGLDARVAFVYDEGGTVYIRANSLQARETGAYTLTLERGGTPGVRVDDEDLVDGEYDDTGESWDWDEGEPDFEDTTDYANAPVVTRGQTVSGQLDEATSASIGDSSLFNPYQLSLNAGQRVVITMRSGDFDAFLSLGLPDNSGVTSVGSDDDGAGGTDARIEFVADRDATYVILASALGSGMQGRYTLTVE